MKFNIKGPRQRKPVPEDTTTPLQRWLLSCILAFVITVIVEGLNQGSVLRMFEYMSQHFNFFFINFLIVLSTLSIGEILHRQRAWILTITILWIGFSIANYMCIVSRTTPLLPGDLLLRRDVIGLSTIYYKWYELIGIAFGLIAIIAGIVFLFLRCPRRKKIHYGNAIPTCGSLILCTAFLIAMLELTGHMPGLTTDRVYAYRNYGFSTCFTASISTMGVQRPQEYSGNTAEEIVSEAEEQVDNSSTPSPNLFPKDTPNIIFIQLESFFDIDTLTGAEYSRDAIPNYHALLKDCPNAALYMPSVGGGTSNSEFEVMTGMNVDFFGAGETTYHTIIETNTCESIAYILRNYKYTSTAMHNNTGTFYSRNIVYANLGYDRFIPIEYMPELEYASNGWSRDENMTSQIVDILRKSSGPDLIFTITVESHGKYADTYEYKPGDVSATNLPEGINEAATLNYINLLPDVDFFIGSLIETISAWDEPTVIVFYGDHLPGLGLEADMLSTKDLYASHYVIWNNFNRDFSACDQQAYRLSADLLGQLGLNGGILMTFHQAWSPELANSQDYMDKLHTLQYDMLYGEQAAYGEKGPYQPTDLKLGLSPVIVHSASNSYKRLMIDGANFNEFSRIMCGDTIIDTIYIDSGRIAAASKDIPADTVHVCVAQVAEDGTVLGKSNAVFIR